VGTELDYDYDLLINAVREAGTIAKEFFGKTKKQWEKKFGEPVSEVDIKINQFLKKRLLAKRSEYGWLSEESPDNEDRLQKRKVWVIDPIDGTRAYLKNEPEYSISAALLVDNKPTIGVVFNPQTEKFFHALSGKGAKEGQKKIKVSDVDQLERSKIYISHREALKLQHIMKSLQSRVRPISSIAYKLSLVAMGSGDAAISISKKSDWDIAAAHVIIEEAGGVLTQINGDKISYNQENPEHASIAAANPKLHEKIIRYVAQKQFFPL